MQFRSRPRHDTLEQLHTDAYEGHSDGYAFGPVGAPDAGGGRGGVDGGGGAERRLEGLLAHLSEPLLWRGRF